MYCDLVIPSRNRRQKLLKCLDSINKAKKNWSENDIQVYVYFDEFKEVEYFAANHPSLWINYRVVKDYRVPTFWNSHLKNMVSSGAGADAMFYCNDDVILHNDTLTELSETYQEKFPDYDGVMGVNQSNLPKEKTIKSAFGVIGKKYATRFPENQVFSPDFYRFFSDQEIYLYATSIGKFHYAENVKIDHLHGDSFGRDDTHREVRKFKEKDILMFNMRQNKKLLWGKTWEILGDNK